MSITDGLMIPDRLPRLAKGLRPPGSGEVCAEQAVDWLVSGRLDLGELTDHPSCVQPVLNALSVMVNDSLPDSERHRMWPLILAQPGTARPEMEPLLSIRLALWCLRRAEHLGPAEVKVLNDAVEAWCECPCPAHGRAARLHAEVAGGTAPGTRAAVLLVEAATSSWVGADASLYAAQAASSVVWRIVCPIVEPAWTGLADALIDLLACAQAEHARLTGHVAAPVDLARIERLGELVGWTP